MKTLPGLFASLMLIVILPTGLEASRVYRPMGDYVREAELIILGDTRQGGVGERSFNRKIIVSVKEVLKGDRSLVGSEITLGLRMSTADVSIPTPVANIAILLRKRGLERSAGPAAREDDWIPLEVYAVAEDLAALRTLARIYRLPEEREQLLALRKEALGGNERCLVQLLADLANMREPSNFNIMTELYDAFTPSNQVKLLDIIARTSDPRAVPTLIKAMESPDAKVGSTAAYKLAWHFPGAPGVTDAFEQSLQQKHLAGEATRYLAKRRDDPALEEVKQETPTARAERLWKTGDRQEARAAFRAILADPNTTAYGRRHAAIKLLPDATAAEKEEMRKRLFGELSTLAASGNYLEMSEAAGILREFRDPDCLPPLLSILPRTDFLYWRAARTATMAIRELGHETRLQAVARLIENLGGAMGKELQGDARIVYLLEIIWLGDKESHAKAADAMPRSWQTDWRAVSRLADISLEPDEGGALVQLLSTSDKLSMRAQEWVILRLGDLKETHAAKVLADLLRERESQYYPMQVLREALQAIGGAEVEREILALMTHEHIGVRNAATEILLHIQGERSRALARRILQEKDYGAKQTALLHLSLVGTPEDLEVILPYCDYWKAERSTHYWAAQAVSSIRDRYDYDVNGPIVKVPAGAKK